MDSFELKCSNTGLYVNDKNKVRVLHVSLKPNAHFRNLHLCNLGNNMERSGSDVALESKGLLFFVWSSLLNSSWLSSCMMSNISTTYMAIKPSFYLFLLYFIYFLCIIFILFYSGFLEQTTKSNSFYRPFILFILFYILYYSGFLEQTTKSNSFYRPFYFILFKPWSPCCEQVHWTWNLIHYFFSLHCPIRTGSSDVWKGFFTWSCSPRSDEEDRTFPTSAILPFSPWP